MKTPAKYCLQTPHNQRCHDDQESQTARRALFQTSFMPSNFELECFDREYHRHHADGKGVHDWRPAAVLLLFLLAPLVCLAGKIPEVPSAVPGRTYYFAATALTATGQESDYSNEATTTNPAPALVWNPSPGAAAYTIWRGRQSRTYTTHWPAGSATNFTIPTPPARTNRVLTLTTANATNLQYRPPGGTWMLANKTNLVFTNPPAAGLLYRPMSRSKTNPARAWITLTNY